MCGIAGFFDLAGRKTYDLELLQKLNDKQLARGPDDEGYFLHPGVAIAHRRLSIIDLNQGHQPIFNENNRVGVVFNGEIYNYKELISELKQCGHRFRTQSDTEVIVHAWEQWGQDCVLRFRGMFAFAIVDLDKDVLFLARDRLGVKPLLYTTLSDGTFFFASDLKVLKAHPLFDSKIDYDALDDFITLGYVLDPGCIYKSVKKLQGGHSLLIERGKSSLNDTQYWDVQFADYKQHERVPETQWIERLISLVDESVGLRMVSDVPVGAFLSGGVDSSVVVASMARRISNPISTFSIAFDHPEFDETQYARQVAGIYRTRHFERVVSSEDFQSIYRFQEVFAEPFADTSAIPMLSVSELASENLKVVLSGDGADEIFGGYRRHRMHLFECKLRTLMRSTGTSWMSKSLGSGYPKLDWAPRFLRAKSTFEALALTPCDAYHHAVSIARPLLREQLYSKSFQGMIDRQHSLKVFRDHYSRSGARDALQAIQYVDLKTYLVGDINTKVDRASMAYSLESREPLMDHKLVEFAALLPLDLKIRGMQGKYILKKSMEERVPKAVMYRPKMGFSVPLAKWFRGPLAPAVNKLGSDSALLDSGWFSKETICRLGSEHQRGNANHDRVLASLLILESFLMS
ncbi:MAG: XrtA/PEP-CTERM system amidotransferase [Planctomycetota bacterium]|jgi:asparagine synthase (glutamine-hydrolysing)